jgi:cold-inducible RNA-binding protein
MNQVHLQLNKSATLQPAPELYVADLSFFCSEDHLRELFCQYGHVVNTRIIRGGVRKRSLSFGFVTMSNLQQAQQAIQALHGHLFMGRHMK